MVYNIGHMKQFFVGALITIIILVVAVLGFRGANSLVSRLVTSPSPSPIASSSPNLTPSPTPSVKPTQTPEPSVAPTTKGGLPVKKTGSVKGTTTITKKVTTTTTHLNMTLLKTSICPVSYMTEVKDITGPLTLKYELIDNTSFGITIWKKDGNELFSNTTFGGRSGTITTISGIDYIKIRVESKSCASNNDNWLKLTAER